MKPRHLLYGAMAVLASLTCVSATAQDISLRSPSGTPPTRSYNLLNNDALLFKTPGMGLVTNLSATQTRVGSDTRSIKAPLAAPPAPGYNVRLQGCNLRAADTDATSIVVFRAHPDYDMTTIVSGDQFRANGGGCYAGNDYYYVNYTQFWGMNIVQFYHYDTVTWERLTVRDASEGCIAYDMTYDPTDGNIYGVFYNDEMNGYVFGTLDPETVTRTAIAPLPCEYFAIAASPDGVIYGIDEDGNLNTLDKATGNISLVGSTGIIPKFKQSAAFDCSTGRLYWVAVQADQNSALYEVDVNTAAVTKIFDLPIEDQIVALDVLTPEASELAPNSVDDFTFSPVETSLKGIVTFTAPDYSYGGTPLSDMLTYDIRLDGATFDSGTIAPGTPRQVTVTVPDAGFHTVSVTTSNFAGVSPAKESRRWFGYDTPTGVRNLTVSADENNINLSWDAPTEGIHGGYIDTDALRYTVVRQPGYTVVSSLQSGTTFSEPYSKDGMASYYYHVTAYTDNMVSETVVSDRVLVGSAFVPPYSEDFETPRSADLYTIIDVHGDGNTWQLEYDEDDATGDMRCGYSRDNAKDDWLITPPIRLEGGKLYNISMQAMARGGFRYPEKMKVVIGTTPTLEGMTAGDIVTVIEEMEFTNRTFEEISGLAQVEEDGTYYIGIHASSDTYMDVIAIDNLRIASEAGMDSPAAVTGLKGTPDADGSLGVTLSFITPSKTIEGDPLASLDKVEIYRGETLVHTMQPVTVNRNYSWRDENPAAGLNTYEIRAYHNDKRGLGATVQVFAGLDVPGRPTNVRITEYDGVVSMTWDAPTVGEQGGVFDTSALTYIVLDAESEVVKTGITETHWDFIPQLPAGQDLYAWSVSAQTPQGIGYSATSNVLALGDPYKMPFSESFIGAVNQTSPWGQYLWGMGGRWFTSDTGLSPLANPQDNDGGLLTFIPAADNDEAMIYSAKIDVTGATAPAVDFWYYYADGMEGDLSVTVSSNYEEYKPVGKVDFTKAHNGWNFIRMPFPDIEGARFVQLGLRASTGSVGRHIHVDNIVVRDPAPTDLAALDVTAPSEIKVGTETTVTATVMNVGTQAAEGYSVELWVNGMQLESQEGRKIQPLETATYEFKVVPTVTMSTKAAFGMKIIYPSDKNLADNTLIAPKVDVEMPRWPTVTDLSGSYDGTNVNLTWSPVSDALIDPNPVTDKFEDYEAFITDNIGYWTVVDVDGGNGTFTINNTSSTTVAYPNAGAPMAFQVFNPSQAGLLLVNGEGSPTGWMPHSGSQVLAAFGDIDGRNDDWLISPRLSGEAQTITFFARSYSDMYGLETIEVLTSQTDRETTSFERVKGIAAEVPAAWTQYNVTVAEGTQYFAIRCTSRNRFVLLVDDISYIPAGAEPTPIAVSGYNVYRNGVRINDALVTEPGFSEPFAAGRTPKYAVTAVYDMGESNFSNIITVATSGIEAAAAATMKVTATAGSLIIEGASGMQLTVSRADGVVIWSGAPASDRLAIPMAPGVYLVASPQATAKVVVK